MRTKTNSRCKAIKKDGERCTFIAKTAGFCGRHRGLIENKVDPAKKYKLPWEKSNAAVNLPFSIGLYYPWIDIYDKGWMKSAALYWDTIRTIVPKSIREPYSNRTAKEFYDEGVLSPLIVHPEMADIEDLTEDVIRYLDCQQTAELLLSSSRKGFTRIHTDKLPSGIRHIARLHPMKMSYAVREMIEDIGLVSESRDGWMSVDTRFADFYMTLLATRLSNKIGAGLLTPSFRSEKVSLNARTDSSLSGFLRRERDFDYSYREKRMHRIPRDLVQGMLVDVSLDHMALDPRTPVSKIMNFRKTHVDELGRFRSEIASLAAEIPSDIPLQHVRQAVNDVYINKVHPAMTDLQDALRGSRIKFLTSGLMKVSFLSAGSSSFLVGMGLDFPNALLVGSGIALTAMGIMFNVDRRRAINSNPYSFLLSVKRELG